MTLQRLLIYENKSEQQRILNEIEIRRSILDKLSSAGLSKDEIISITSSLENIESYIRARQLEENPTFKALTESGIKGLKVELSPELKQLSHYLNAWCNYRMTHSDRSKFESLIFKDAWEIDEIALENTFIRTRAKVYIEENAIEEYQMLRTFQNYLEKKRCPNNQIVNTAFLNTRYECIGQFKFKIRWQYFEV